MLDEALVQLEATLLQTPAAARMTRVQNGYRTFCHLIDCRERRSKVNFSINVRFAVRRQKNILTLFQAQASMDVKLFDFFRFWCNTSVMGELVT